MATLFDKGKYEKVTSTIKKKHAFMALRFISIKYPIEANAFNKLKSNPVVAMDHWNLVLSSKYKGRQPSWMYTKTIKEDKKSDIKYDDKVLDEYCRIYDITDNELTNIKEFFPLELKDELKSFKARQKDS